MVIKEILSLVIMGIGVFFFIGGILGVLRFPDIYTRLHALTKADNIGLGLIVIGQIILISDPVVALKLILVWGLVAFSSATSCYIIAQKALQMQIKPREGSGHG